MKQKSKWIRPSWGVKPPKEANRRTAPSGCYVYAWFKGDDLLPFYVGRGVDWRAWQKHYRQYAEGVPAEPAPCEVVRSSAERFRVEIVREGLTDEGAILLESALIDFVAGLGADLSNVSRGHHRKDRPPLTIEAAWGLARGHIQADQHGPD